MFLSTIIALSVVSTAAVIGADISTDERCGKDFNNTECPDQQCCSQFGWCGVSKAHCGTGCQSNCDSFLPYLYDCLEPNKVAMTFDDGPSDNWELLFDILDEVNVTTTFFVIGENIEGREGNLTEALARGHGLGIHTWTHPDLTTLPDENVTEEIVSTADAITNATCGYIPIYVRPPYLELTKRVYYIITNLGYGTVWVNIDTNDWQYATTDPEKMYTLVENAIVEKWDTSYIMLQHDRYIESVQMVPRLVDLWRSKGFEFVTLDECFGIDHDSKVEEILKVRNAQA